ncbi:MAG: putative bifunctional diguanylate cyclase/phosphodiesterase [Candidatus Sericytochromatia bacterium]
MEQILIIDDAEAIRTMMTEILTLAGYHTLEADGVQSGIAAALRHGPDLILCDVVLGDGSGYDILNAIQEHPRLQMVPFIFVSGVALEPEDIRKGMLSGADDYLPKPFRVQELIETVKARLQRARRLAGPGARTLARCYAGSYEALQQLLEDNAAKGRSFCLLAIGLHRFERFLRLYGWHEADRLVQSLVERLLSQLEGICPAAYLSHEPHKFYLLWEGQIQSQAANNMVQRVLRGLAQPQNWEEHVLRLGAQAGVVLGPVSQATARADLALHRAEVQGPGNSVLFAEGMEQDLLIDLKWEEELYQALEQGRFELHYQPQYELSSQRLCGAEALLRLRHPQLGMVSPATFIPVAEECGLMLQIGTWVLETACRQICQWWQEDGVLLKLAVNVSQLQFQRQDFAAVVAGVLESTGLDCRALELELTESMLMQDPTATLRQLKALKGLGLSLSMDDFGTGYSSLATLSQLPFDILKIDQSFVLGLDGNPVTQAIPRAITEMGHSLGLKVLAEGIETEHHQRLLLEMGCDLGQGFWFSRPLPAEQLRQYWQK